MENQKTIFVAPLDWGLGHAVRMIPIIHLLKNNGYNIILGGTGKSGEILCDEFPEYKYYELPGAKIRYSRKFLLLKLIFQVPKFLKSIRKERNKLKKIMNAERIDLIISDNRYGIHNKNITSIFIGHQIRPKLPNGLTRFEDLVESLQISFLKPFTEILIPDYKGEINLTGDLSQSKLKGNYSYIGPLSQFKVDDNTYAKLYDILVILSGPEPQRTKFEQLILSQLSDTDKKVLIVRAKPENDPTINNKNIEIVDHLTRKDMENAIKSSETIISRAGYTTIMDLITLQKKAVLVPTPGQTEQEYLAAYLRPYGLFVFKEQRDFNIVESFTELQHLTSDFNIFIGLKFDSLLDIVKKYI